MHVADKPLKQAYYFQISTVDSNSSTVILVINIIIYDSETLVNQNEIMGNISHMRG